VANIKLYAQLLRSGRRPEKTDRYLEVMAEQVERLEHLVRDILELTDLDSGRATMAMHPVRLSAMIEDSLAAHQRQATAAEVTLESEPVPVGLQAVMGDQARLSQALRELINNAITFTPHGGEVTVAAGTAEREGERWVAIAVRDSGVGIPSSEQERVFDRFYRGSAADSGHVPGSGLGLSIVREIMRTHGGRVTVESREGEGSTFTLWLRVAA
jgi:signal transduction histidine kinase